MALRNLGKVKGDPGKDSTITIVDPVTLAPGQSATAQNIGTSQNVILKLGIPQGPRGYPGESVQGPKGDRGMPGEDGKDGKAATIDIHGTTIVDNDEDVRVENVGSANAASLHFYQKRIPDPMAVDGEFIDDSENPVQSKVIKEALEAKADIDSLPTKTSDLSNDSGFISSSSVEVMIEDALQDAVLTANPVDDELSLSSSNAVKNSVVAAALNDKVEMDIEDILDENDTKTGERITFGDGNRSVSMLLRGEEVYETQFLTSVTKNREPVIVASLPDVGEETKLYLVPSGEDNFSMHLWMDVAGEMKYVNVNGGGGSNNFSGSYNDLTDKPTAASIIGGSLYGGQTQPIFWNGSNFQNTAYSIGKSVPSNAVFTANSKNTDGYVSSPNGAADKVWGTDSGGNPSWIDIPAPSTQDIVYEKKDFRISNIKQYISGGNYTSGNSISSGSVVGFYFGDRSAKIGYKANHKIIAVIPAIFVTSSSAKSFIGYLNPNTEFYDDHIGGINIVNISGSNETINDNTIISVCVLYIKTA